MFVSGFDAQGSIHEEVTEIRCESSLGAALLGPC